MKFKLFKLVINVFSLTAFLVVFVFFRSAVRANCGLPHADKAKAPDAARVDEMDDKKQAPLKYGLRVGEQAPDFESPTDAGEVFKLREALKKGPVVLVFYRGGWCPYCNKQMNELKKDLDEFKKRGAVLVALSVDKVDKAAETQMKSELGFSLLSDPDAEVIGKYNLTLQLDAPTLDKYKGYGIDLEAASGRTHHQIAVPAVFVIDTDGRIARSYVNEDYKVRAANEEIFKALDDLHKQAQ